MTRSRTRFCPKGNECGICGRRRRLVVCEAETDFGTACVTVCESCAERGELPPIGMFAAAVSVNAHRTHLGLEAVR